VCAVIYHQYTIIDNNRDVQRHTETYRDIQRHIPVITVTKVVSMQRHTDSREKKKDIQRHTETYDSDYCCKGSEVVRDIQTVGKEKKK
jgi:hypothetical protein